MEARLATDPGPDHRDERRAPDAALVRLEPAAVDAFYREHVDVVYAFVYARLHGARSDAEDVTQESFMTALARIGSFDGRSSVRTWLLGIAKLKVYERLRQRDRLRVDCIDRALSEIADRDVPAEIVESEQTAVLVGAALAELPPHYQAALTEKYVEGLTVADMAERRRCSEKAAESMLQRARRAFAEALLELTGTHGPEESHE